MSVQPVQPYTLEELGPYLQLEPEKEKPLATITSISPAYTPTGRPGDDFNAQHSTTEVLQWLGFTYSHTDSTGSHWARPGKDPKQGASATVYPDGGAAIWSSTVLDFYPHVELRRSYDAYGLLVATKYAGDFNAAARDLASSGYGEPSFLGEETGLIQEIEDYLRLERSASSNDWRFVDLTVAAKMPRPKGPDILRRTDGVCLLYRSKLNFAFGPPESGKSWFAQLACVQLFNEGKSFLYIDFENDATDVAEHFQLLGADPDQLGPSGRAFYLSPGSAWTEEAKELVQIGVSRKPDLVVVDGVTGAMTTMGRTPESNSDFSHFEREFLRPLMASEAALLCIDHTPKNAEKPTLFGAQHKRAATTGAAYNFFVIDPPARGKEGRIRIFIHKDKSGYMRSHATENDQGDYAIADLHLTPQGPERVLAELHPVTTMSQEPRIAAEMSYVLHYIETNPHCTAESVQRKTKLNPWAVHTAIRFLLQEGRIERASDNTFFAKSVP